MKYIEEIFDNIELEKFQRDGDCIYDSIRSFLLAATPEECVRQKTIVYLQQQLGIPVNRIFVEESMAHTKKGARGRADIVVYRDDECTDVLMIIECKAPYINVLGDEVFKQASGYREILNAEYIMLVNGVEAVVYIYNDGEYFEVKDIPSFEELLSAKISIT
ncbi:type I restriction enzyme HsdR N-terminal domain-containing protein [Veillonella sp.]|nr:type I restriction enzyme HsdR N-terminal domain-containing protein [Veillonella sp.]MDU4573704.1 type I restriction enzyme HsdR N-terminal domain-containing protein [Veillonella sp.]